MMKQRKSSRCLAALLALCLLCACGAPEQAAPGAADHTAPADAAGAAPQGGALVPLTADTEEGHYTVGLNGDIQLLCYIDYASATEVPLCSQPSCAHDSDACTAFLSPDMSAYGVTASGGSIFFLRTMHQEPFRPDIWTAEQSGANRRALVQGGTGEVSFGPIAQDGVFLYYACEKVSTEDQTSRTVFGRVPLSGGEREELFSFDGIDFQFLGVSGRAMILYTYQWEEPPEVIVPEDATEEEMRELFDARHRDLRGSHEVFWMDVDTGERHTLDTWESTYGSAGRSCLWWEDRLYWCSDTAPGPIYWMDLEGRSGELPAPQEGVRIDTGFMLSAPVQGRLTINQYNYDTDMTSTWALDPATGESTALTLRCVRNGSERPLLVLGQNREFLLVQYEEQADFSAGFYEDGSPRTILTVSRGHGLISFEDYFAGRPNYRSLEEPYNFYE